MLCWRQNEFTFYVYDTFIKLALLSPRKHFLSGKEAQSIKQVKGKRHNKRPNTVLVVMFPERQEGQGMQADGPLTVPPGHCAGVALNSP